MIPENRGPRHSPLPRPRPTAEARPTPRPQPQLRPAPKPQPAPAAKKGFVDRWADRNDAAGLRANGIKSFSDAAMALKGGRDVRTERYQFGPWNISKQAHKTVTTRNTAFTRGASGAAGALGAAQLLPSGASAARDIRDGFRHGWTAERRDKAIGSSAGFASTALNTYKSFTELRTARQQVRDVTNSFRHTIERQALKTTNPAHASTIRAKAGETASKMAKRFVGGAGDVRVDDIKHIADTTMRRAVSGGASKAIASNGLKAAKTAGAVAGKTAGRFVPGVNVAIAAADTAAFYGTLKDKDASVGKKVAAGITAAGSVLAATNIPIVSQAGAAISTVSSVVGAIGPEKIGNAVKDVAKKLKFW